MYLCDLIFQGPPYAINYAKAWLIKKASGGRPHLCQLLNISSLLVVLLLL